MRHSGPISCLSHIQNHLVTGGYDGCVGLYNIDTTQFVAFHRFHNNLISCIAARGQLIVSGAADYQIICVLFDGQYMKRLYQYQVDDDIEAIEIVSSTAVLFATGSGDLYFTCFSDEELCSAETVHLGSIGSKVTRIISFDGTTGVLTANDGGFYHYTLFKHSIELKKLYQAELPLKNALYLKDQDASLIGGHDGELMYYCHQTGATTQLTKFKSSVRGLTYHPQRQIVYVGIYDSKIYQCDVRSLHDLRFEEIPSTSSLSDLWTRDLCTVNGKSYATSMNGYPVAIQESGYFYSGSNINTFASHDEGYALIGLDDGRMISLKISAGEIESISQRQYNQCITSVCSDGLYPVTATWSGALFYNDQLIHFEGLPLLGVAVDDEAVFVGNYEGEVIRINKRTKQADRIKALSSSTKNLVLDSGYLYVVGRYSPMAVIDVSTFTLVNQVEIETRVSDAIAISPNGELLAVAAKGNDIWVYTTEDLLRSGVKPHVRLAGSNKASKSFAWVSPECIVSVGYDAIVRAYRLDGIEHRIDLSSVASIGLSGVIKTADCILVSTFSGKVIDITSRFESLAW